MTENNQSPNSKTVKDYYNNNVPEFTKGYFHFRWGQSALRFETYLQTKEALLRCLKGVYVNNMVEVGSGPCVWSSFLHQHSDHFVAMDLSLAMLEQSPAHEAVLKCCADAAHLPLSDYKVEALASLRAFEYFPDKLAALIEFWRVLTPDGFLLIATKNRKYSGYSQHSDPKKKDIHSGNLTPSELVGLLKQAGFVEIQLRPAYLGRTKIILLWKFIRYFRRFIDPIWQETMPNWLSDISESYIVTARKK